MAGPAVQGDARCGLALMGANGAHIAGFADDGTSRRGTKLRQAGDEMGNATAARLLVIGKGNMHRPFKRHARKCRCCSEHSGEKPFHVGGSAPVKPVVFGSQPKRIGRPFRFSGRHHIHVARRGYNRRDRPGRTWRRGWRGRPPDPATARLSRPGFPGSRRSIRQYRHWRCRQRTGRRRDAQGFRLRSWSSPLVVPTGRSFNAGRIIPRRSLEWPAAFIC